MIAARALLLLALLLGAPAVALAQTEAHGVLGYQDANGLWHAYDTTGAGIPVSGGATPTAGTYAIAGCTVGVSSASCIATSTVVNHVLIQNTSATANVACHWAGGTAVLNSSGSVQLGPGQSALWGPTTSGIPSGAMNCIASAASTPLYVEYN